MCCCNFIPRYVFENISTRAKSTSRQEVFKNALAIAENNNNKFRNKRKRIQDAIRRGQSTGFELIKDHREILKVYNCNYSWDDPNPISSKLWEEYIEDLSASPDVRKLPRRLFTKSMDSIHDVFHTVYDRHSFDGEGAVIQSFLKYGNDYANAYWDGQYLVFGSGDKYLFTDFSKIHDVVAHELGHGITQYECNLAYEKQSGALNEHVSDVIGAVCYQKKNGLSVDNTNWLIGEGLFTRRVNGVALRSMKAPGTAYDDPILGKDPQPDHMSNYQDLPNDNSGDWGGVHVNSGIPNKAFYLYSTSLGGNSWDNGSFEIWYNTILKKNGLSPYSTFKQFAEKTMEIALGLGKNITPLENAWKSVGII